jgi:serine/threonine-protein kinase
MVEDPERPSYPSHLPPGAVIDKKYAVERVLGGGGMGVVYLAKDILTETHVVLKAIRSAYAHRADYRDRILKEGRALARIDHPNVVRMNAIAVEDDALYLVMQFIEGESLDAIIDRHVAEKRLIPAPEALRIFRQIVEGVAAVHREGIIHRDLKPANVLVRARDGAIKVTDFGIAKEEEEAKQGRGKTRGVIGSLPYMAPEQCVRGARIDKRVDIYALGILLFELLTGRVPFDADAELEVMRMHTQDELPSVSALRKDLPQEIDAVLRKASAKKPDERFSSCEELLAALGRAMGGEARGGSGGMAREAARAGAVTTAAAPIAAPPLREEARGGSPAMLRVSVMIAAAGAAAVVGALVLGRTAEPTQDSRRGVASASARAQGQSGPTASSAGTASAGPGAAGSGAAVGAKRGTDLSGEWKSDSGRVYDVAWSNGAYEFRIRDAGQFPSQGYEIGEARFLLRPILEETDTFLVEDRIRPFPPEGTRYDPAKSRDSCVEVWTDVGGRPLRAQIDGDRLWVRMALLEPEASMFQREGSLVIGCKGLKSARASEVDSFLTRKMMGGQKR